MTAPTVLIIAGGANSRFSPFQSLGHKSGFEVCGEPIMARTLRNLAEQGFAEVVCIITPADDARGYTKQIVEAAKTSLRVRYAVQQQPLGMGDAVLTGTAALNESERKRFAVISGYHTHAGEVLKKMLTLGEGTVLSSNTVTHSLDYGILSINSDGFATGIVEKPKKGSEPSDQRVLSLYILDAEYLTQLRQTPIDELSFEIALDAILARSPAPILRMEQRTPTLKYAWHILPFLHEILGELTSHTSESAQIAPTAVIDTTSGPVHIGAGARIGHAAKVAGPCFIGDEAAVGDFSLVRHSSLEKGAQVGCFTEVARSIIGADAHIHSGFIGDSIIGARARIGAGFVTANKRLDRKSIGVTVKKKVVDSGITALGALVGEAAKIGIHASIMPGKIIEAGAIVMPHTCVDHNQKRNDENDS